MRIRRLIVLVLIAIGLVWFYYWYVRGINLLLDEPVADPPPYSWATRLEARASLSWFTAAPMPTPRTAAAAAALDGVVYVIGGQDGFLRDLDVVEAFDVAENSWRTVAPLPQPLRYAAAAALDGKVYVMGGLSGVSGEPLSSVYVFDAARGEWRRLSDLPVALSGAAAVVMDGRVHLVGGESRLSTLDHHLILDSASGTWSSSEPLPAGRGRLGVAVLGGRLWVLGGRGGSTLYSSAEVYVFDPVAEAWDDAVSLPTTRHSFVVGTNSKIYVFGGEAATVVLSRVDAFDTATGQWERLVPMTHPRYAAAFAQVGNQVFVIGGSARPGLSVSDLNEAFILPSGEGAVER